MHWLVVERAAAETATGFNRKHVGWSALTQRAWVEEQTGYGKNSAGVNGSHTPPSDFRVDHFPIGQRGPICRFHGPVAG
jgi:hypothetical protein